ncbi:hypothetical protein AOB60_00985 [Streptomyces noursei]|uniref:Uncharacterized protein n=1 Tax=Streptomyces noursei TaxID=1971 RepID=A0A2N8PRB6_STRNR|nr:hypothetical protein AOB60_00985 [Streptomyces noursei]
MTAISAAATAVVCAAVAQAAPASQADAPAAAAGEPPSAVEDFSYPGAAAILKEKGLKLTKGDGGILLTECESGSWNIKVKKIEDWEASSFCFKTPGNTGYLALEVPGTFSIQTADRTVQATLTSEGKKKVVDAPKNVITPVGTGDIPGGGKEATLVELRVKG